ncbi:MAG TPA: succinyldiaminopimelate transaminase [Gammaproteobacteria bacterium]|nr:succinyldiaminopimelate transaminase [Gammaproteobacteria bacterium]
MHDALSRLQPYPFEKLAQLKAAVRPAPKSAIDLSIGEPQHETPPFILQAMTRHLPKMAKYPTTRGSDELRTALARWLRQRFKLPTHTLTAERHVLPVSGTREGLFAIAQCVVDRTRAAPVVVMPNPFYQIYEGAALLAGATPCFLNCTAANQYTPDLKSVPEGIWQRCQLLYLCSPGNPTGNVLNRALYEQAFALADQFDFIIAADECYSEIYQREEKPPAGLLQIAAQAGRTDYRRCIVFHSLSKRSSVPGLRSGFVAGDADLLEKFLRYRTYHGCALPLPTQHASCAAWSDEAHVIENRRLYRQKYDAVLPILKSALKVERPEGGFYLWPELPMDDVAFASGLLTQQNVTVLPGTYLAREAHGMNPGARRVRMALVPPLAQCVEAAHRIKEFVETAGRK